ncbi:MAG: hypothetical protein ACI8QS_001818 [Planctomycetota bacterium]|jgi:hypothetical protein
MVFGGVGFLGRKGVLLFGGCLGSWWKEVGWPYFCFGMNGVVGGKWNLDGPEAV